MEEPLIHRLRQISEMSHHETQDELIECEEEVRRLKKPPQSVEALEVAAEQMPPIPLDQPMTGIEDAQWREVLQQALMHSTAEEWDQVDLSRIPLSDLQSALITSRNTIETVVDVLYPFVVPYLDRYETTRMAQKLLLVLRKKCSASTPTECGSIRALPCLWQGKQCIPKIFSAPLILYLRLKSYQRKLPRSYQKKQVLKYLIQIRRLLKSPTLRRMAPRLYRTMKRMWMDYYSVWHWTEEEKRKLKPPHKVPIEEFESLGYFREAVEEDLCMNKPSMSSCLECKWVEKTSTCRSSTNQGQCGKHKAENECVGEPFCQWKKDKCQSNRPPSTCVGRMREECDCAWKDGQCQKGSK